ncbi:MAG: tetratricopeptide repeat protein [Deltaproteobacteria bacterium]
MIDTDHKKLFAKGVDAINSGDMVSALAFFERVTQLDNSPTNRSYLAFCIARERGQFKKAITMCEEVLREEPGNSLHYLNLGKVYILSGQRTDAMRILREGLHHGEDKDIVNEMIKLGMRKPTVIPFFKRENLLNKYLGVILTRLGLR